MYVGLIKDETPETITLNIGLCQIDGSTCEMLLVCDKGTILRRTDKVACVSGHAAPLDQKNMFRLTVGSLDK